MATARLDLDDTALGALFQRARPPQQMLQNIEQQAAAAPLLNSDKLAALRWRWLETLSGGVRWMPQAPAGTCLPQLLLFLAPLLVSTPGILWSELGAGSELQAGFLSGGLAVLLLLTRILVRARGGVAPITDTARSSALPTYDGKRQSFVRTSTSVLPSHSFPEMVLALVFVTWLCGGATVFLLPSRLATDVEGTTGGVAVLFCVGWLSLLTSVYALQTAHAPAQPSVFRLEAAGQSLPLWSRPMVAAMLLGLAISYQSQLSGRSTVLYALWCLLPILWAVGWLPPVDALLSWSAEQYLVLGLGGSAMASERRLWSMVAISSVAYGLVLLCVAEDATVSVIGVGLAAFFGSLFAQDLSTQARIFRAVATSLLLPLPLAVLLVYFAHPLRNDSTRAALDTLVWLLWAADHLRSELQLPVCAFGWLTNPFFRGEPRRPGLASKASAGLTWISALVMVSVVSLRLYSGSARISTGVLAFGVVRAFRWPWQDTSRALFDLGLTVLLQRVVSHDLWWDTALNFELQFLAVAFLHLRFNDCTAKLSFMLRAATAAWTLKKLRHPYTAAIFMMSLALSPLLLGILGLSVLLAAPIMSVFGLPIFFMAFPRPLRFWPLAASIACTVPDSQFYLQALPALKQFVLQRLAVGAMGQVQPGDHWLLRFQNRFVWVHILETGFGHVTAVFKGLELQETSCHTLEANMVEQRLEAVFSQSKPRLGCNRPTGVDLLPLASGNIWAYSDTRNALTGVVDTPNFAANLQSNFMVCLLWLWHSLGSTVYQPLATRLPSSVGITEVVVPFPALWYKYLQGANLVPEPEHLKMQAPEDYMDKLLTSQSLSSPLSEEHEQALERLCNYCYGLTQDRLSAGRQTLFCNIFAGVLPREMGCFDPILKSTTLHAFR